MDQVQGYLIYVVNNTKISKTEMSNSPIHWTRSIKARFILLLLIGGMTAGAIGLSITHQATDDQLEQRLILRVGTLAGAINHTAMVSPDWSIVQHMIEAIIQDESDIKQIVVADRSSAQIVAAIPRERIGLSVTMLKDEHLRSELLNALKQGVFGSHFETNHHHRQAGDLVVLTPLQPAMNHGSASANHSEHGSHDSMPASNRTSTMTGLTLSQQITKNMHNSSGPMTEKGPYRGVIMISANKSTVKAAAWDVLEKHFLALLAAVVTILLVAYFALKHQVLSPLNKIKRTIDQRRLGDADARISVTNLDEISFVALALNRTLDTENQQTRQLSEINEQLAQAAAAAEAANIAKSSFLANMSHELRTPLNAIIGFSEIMKPTDQQPGPAPKFSEYATDINNAGQHLLKLINDILDLSKIESEKEEIYEETIDVGEAIKATISMVSHRAEKNNISLKAETTESLPNLRADDRKVKQILLNLLTNAIKFTPPGGTATISASYDPGDSFKIQVADTGIGIAAEDIDKALSQFGQVESTYNRTFDGTGLGLPLTNALAKLHGGSLELESQLNLGTTVTIKFPSWRVISEAQKVA